MNKTEQQYADILIELDVHYSIAKTVILLNRKGSHCSLDLEREARLHQPEISSAIRQLEQKGWIKRTEKRGKGKGRPTSYYQLTTDLNEILSYYQQQKEKELQRIQQTLKKLRKLQSSTTLTS